MPFGERIGRLRSRRPFFMPFGERIGRLRTRRPFFMPFGERIGRLRSRRPSEAAVGEQRRPFCLPRLFLGREELLDDFFGKPQDAADLVGSSVVVGTEGAGDDNFGFGGE